MGRRYPRGRGRQAAPGARGPQPHSTPFEPTSKAPRARGRPVGRPLLRFFFSYRPPPPPGTIREQSNALVRRLTQAYLTARKGTGFLRTEPAQRWARQALFFLV